MATNLFDLTGQTALVTGASRGIGESIAKLHAEQGAHIIVTSRKLNDGQADEFPRSRFWSGRLHIDDSLKSLSVSTIVTTRN